MKRQVNLFLVIVIVLIVFIILSILPNKKEGIIRDTMVIDIDPARPMVALTFDDGPNYEYTIPILDILYEHSALATFFIIGSNIEGNEVVLQKIQGEGHQIANHTFDHYDLSTLSPQEIKEQLKRTQEKVNEIIQGYSLDYVRPPYGSYNQEVLQAIDYPIALWSIDSKDWELNNPNKIADIVVKEVTNQSVIVMHDTSTHSVEATKIIVSSLVKRGYQFVPLKNLYECRKDVLNNHQIYR